MGRLPLELGYPPLIEKLVIDQQYMQINQYDRENVMSFIYL